MPQVSRLKIQIYGNETQCPVNIMDTMDFAQLFDDDRMNQDKSEKESDKPSKKEKESDGKSGARRKRKATGRAKRKEMERAKRKETERSMCIHTCIVRYKVTAITWDCRLPIHHHHHHHHHRHHSSPNTPIWPVPSAC
jgi:hypothetical protein